MGLNTAEGYNAIDQILVWLHSLPFWIIIEQYSENKKKSITTRNSSWTTDLCFIIINIKLSISTISSCFTQHTFANFLPTTPPHRVQKWIRSRHDSMHKQLIPTQAKGDSNTHQTQAAAPISLLIRVIHTFWHFGHLILTGYLEKEASLGYFPLSLGTFYAFLLLDDWGGWESYCWEGTSLALWLMIGYCFYPKPP